MGQAYTSPARLPGFLECSREEKLTGYNMTMLFMVIEHYTHGPEPDFEVFPVIKSDEAARRTGVRDTPGQ